MKLPKTCAVCSDGVKLQDPPAWCCGRVWDNQKFYTFPTIQKSSSKLPIPPKWCPKRSKP